MTDASGPAAHRAVAPDPSAATLGNLLDTLRVPAVRDLAWLLLSADLLRAQPPVGALARPFDSPQEAAATVDWLRALEADPAGLQRELAATRITRLGRYAERLLGWFLQDGPAARLVAAGVPLRRAGVTLGECDFLVQTQQGARLHWELAVKCYLHAGESRAQPAARSVAQSVAGLADYVGPNLKDRFDLKLAHVLNHQLPLSAREEFASVGYAGPWTPQMFIKGWLFYRAGETPADPVELDPSHGRGWWVTRDDWPDFAAAHAQTWRALPRLEWLAPRRHEPGAASAVGAVGGAVGDAGAVGTPGESEGAGFAFVDARTLAAQTSHQHGPTMVAAFVDDSAGNRIERSRGFIVPNEWPELAQAYARQSREQSRGRKQ
ncbi:DUF1853 family protein [Paraburkholderia haematera]|uniref:DUF1853 family protein n=1 Tax=Paraburkholderia haematera TaxID=2793077 RepID=A0ABN7KVG0_9BURK|nr:DUF1853 family protein [Paraburkholderia haematera]CAE6715556.1 hypothetical protein R69888_01361 [Paraburkholderia haematera]